MEWSITMPLSMLVWALVLTVGDVVTTLWGVTYSSKKLQAELNPVSRWWLRATGKGGFTAWKLVATVVFLEWGWQRGGAWLGWGFVGALALAVGWNSVHIWRCWPGEARA